MNALLLAAIVLGGGYFLATSKPPSRQIAAGKSYEATFKFPPGFPTDLIPKAFPDGAGFTVNDAERTVTATFVAPANGEVGNVTTPVGVLVLVSLRELS